VPGSGSWAPLGSWPPPLGLEFDLDFLRFVRFHPPSWIRKNSANFGKNFVNFVRLSVFKQFFK
jgi:hypothetical protein